MADDDPAVTAPPPDPRGGRFAPVLLLLVALPAVAAFLPVRAGTVVTVVLAVMLWIAIARATGLCRRTRDRGLLAGVALVITAVVALAADRDGLLAATEFATAAAILGVLVVLGRSLIRQRVVTLSTVGGVLSAYLMIGLFFASLYQGALLLDDAAFASALLPLERFDLLYFSFITLATVGYGDIVPTIDATRAMAMTEGVVGQLFLVTVVARVVSTFSGRRPREGEGS